LTCATLIPQVAKFDLESYKWTMAEYTEKQCPECGQQLRFPQNVGGVVMACPSCGNKFYSDFKFGGAGRSKQRGKMATLFEMPGNMIKRLFRS
jgi:rRNA maturation protein Nop10